MNGQDRLIGAGLAIVLIAGIVDATAGHNGSSQPTPAPIPISTRPILVSPSSPVSAAPTVTQPTPRHPVRAVSPTSPVIPAPASATPAATAVAPATTPPSATPAPSSSSGVPKGVLGTFTYATRGSEQLSIGVHHTYPARSTITNRLKGPCVSSTWKPVKQHVQTQVVCPDGYGLKVASYSTAIDFGIGQTSQTFTCSGDSYIYKPAVKAGQVWRYVCKSADDRASQTATVVGYQRLKVGGKTVRTLHVKVNTRLTGSESGTSTEEYWIETGKPVLVKELGGVDATEQGVKYTESYSLTLTSLSPKS